jgi:hypothetical protein
VLPCSRHTPCAVTGGTHTSFGQAGGRHCYRRLIPRPSREVIPGVSSDDLARLLELPVSKLLITLENGSEDSPMGEYAVLVEGPVSLK